MPSSRGLALGCTLSRREPAVDRLQVLHGGRAVLREQYSARVREARMEPISYQASRAYYAHSEQFVLFSARDEAALGILEPGRQIELYRFKGTLPTANDSKEGAEAREKKKPETCNEVFDRFIAHCELRVSKDDMALSTLKGYREILDEIGQKPFDEVIYSRLAESVADNARDCKKKTYNNITSAARTAFMFGYKDFPGKANPALALPSFRITTKDRPKVDPFTIQDAESIIAASHRMHGEWYGNYEEFRFFTGLRQSEEFALQVDDCDLVNGKISVTKAVVEEEMKNRTKT